MNERSDIPDARTSSPQGWSHRLKPGVDRNVLILIAGLMWIGVGALLLTHAVSWLRADDLPASAWWFAIPGAAAALVIHHFGFLRIVDRNLGRIRRLEGKRCLFSFMPLKSYAMVAVMVGMGIGLRHSSIPKPYLSVVYLAIGGALVLSSVRYLRVLIQSLGGPA